MRWLLLFALAGCTRALDLPDGQADCSTFQDRMSCEAAGCALATPCCPGPGFPGCVQEGTNQAYPCFACATSVACSAVPDEESCNARADCIAFYTLGVACDSLGCESHFDHCSDQRPFCGTDCPEPPDVSCNPGYVMVSTSGGCADACVLGSVCGD